MKKFKLFKSGFCEKLKLLLIPIGLLIGNLTMPAWGGNNYYAQNNSSRIYFNDYNSRWVSDPSSNGIAFLMGRDGGNAGAGSQAYRMTHIAHTKLWYCDVPKWGDNNNDNAYYQFVAFRFAAGTTGWDDWQGGWDNRVSARATYGSNTKYSVTVNDNITGRTKYYSPSSSSSNTGYTVNSEAGINSFKYTAYLRVNFDEEADGTYDGVISGDAQWSHGVTFDFTGTYLVSYNTASEQSTISNLDRNYWTDGSKKYGYEGIPNTGEVTFELKTIDTGFEIAGWAYSESATSPAYTDNKNNPTFQVLSETSYVAMIRRKSYTITLNDNGGSGGSGSVTTTYDRSYNMTSNVTVPTKTGYTFQGYYTNSDGTGTQIIDANGAWKKDITGYTGTDDSSNPKWIRDEEVTLHAHWTAKTYTSANNIKGGVGSDGTYTATFDNTSIVINTAPSRSGYHVTRYYLAYSAPDYSNPIAESNGELIKNAVYSSTYTDSDGKWKYDGGPTIYAKWAGNAHTLTLYKNDGSNDYSSTAVTIGSNSYTITKPSRTGYTFVGFYTAASGGDKIINSDLSKPTTDYFDGSSNWLYDDDVELYAHWSEVTLTFDNNSGAGDGSWNTAANWSPACVPTSGHDVTINAETIISGSAVAKSVSIGEGGKVTIAATGALEVAGTVASDDPDKLVINTSSSSQGALICNNSAGTTQATVNLTTQYANGKFQFIAIPLYGVSVASTFSGKGKYTYGWKYGEGWERRGYYDAFTAFEAVLLMGQTYTSFAGALVSTNDFSASLSYDASKVSGDVYMYGNSWTAPIRRSDMTLSGISSINILNGSSNGWDGVVSGDVIPALQGYAAVVGSSGGSISIDYDAAVRNAATPNASLRAPKRNVSDPIAVYVTGNEMQTRIRLFEDEQFTDELDEGYEALYMEGNGYAGELYAMGAKKMNVLATSDLEGTVVGFVPGQATEYTISFAGEGKGYYLNDIEAQESTLISEENTYTFLSGTNDAARFIVSRTPISKTTTGNEVIYDGVKARKQMIDGILYIIKDGRMYNAEGMIVK